MIMEKNFEVPQLLDTQLSKTEHPLTVVVAIFIVAVAVVLIMGGVALYCIYKGGNLDWSVRLDFWNFKIACYINK